MLRGMFICAAALAMALQIGSAAAQDASEVYTLARGAKIYDKWYGALKADKPESTHPAYPAEAKKKGASTWRCKECHGWDYIGAEGRYSSGSHYTGIKGVSGAAGSDPAAIAALLRAEPHGYTADMIPDDAMAELALFVSKGQIDPRPYMAADGSSSGDAAKGKIYYETVCAGCHGLGGKKIKDADPLGAVAGNT